MTYADVERAKAIVIVGLDLEQEVPILHLRVRKAARLGARVFVIGPRRTRLADVAEHLSCRPGDEAAVLGSLWGAAEGTAASRVAAALRESAGSGVVLAGARLAGSAGAVARAADVAAEAEARFAVVSRRAGDHGALRAGLHPRLLPGGRLVTDDAARAHVEVAWGRLLSGEAGRDARAILEAAAAREIDVLFLVGCDPLRDSADAALARRALENAPFRVVVDIAQIDMSSFADVLLPAAAAVERDGTFTDWEGRPQTFRRVRPAPGLAVPDWEIFAGLARAMGHDLGFGTLEDVRAEVAAVHAGAAERPAHRTPEAGAPSLLGESGGGDLILFTYPLLVDEGRQLWGAEQLKEALQEPAFVEVHPDDAAARALSEGAVVRLRTQAGEATLPVRVTDAVAAGSVFVPWNQPGFAANTLLSGRTTAAVSLEPAGAPAGVGAGADGGGA